MSIKDSDWSDDSPFKPLAKHSFFAYSGADGDLLRKNGLPGWRVSVYGRYSVRIQRKGDYWAGTQYWNTVKKWEVAIGDSLSEEQLEEFENALDTLVERGDLEE